MAFSAIPLVDVVLKRMVVDMSSGSVLSLLVQVREVTDLLRGLQIDQNKWPK